MRNVGQGQSREGSVKLALTKSTGMKESFLQKLKDGYTVMMMILCLICEKKKGKFLSNRI